MPPNINDVVIQIGPGRPVTGKLLKCHVAPICCTSGVGETGGQHQRVPDDGEGSAYPPGWIACTRVQLLPGFLHRGTLQETADSLQRAVGANGADPLGSICFKAVPGRGLQAALETNQHLLELVTAECPSDMDQLPLDKLDEVDQRRQPDIQRRGFQALPVAQLAGLVLVEGAVGNVADVLQVVEQAWTVALAVEDVLNDATHITHCPPSDLLRLVTSGHDRQL